MDQSRVYFDKNYLFNAYRFNLAYAGDLVRDVLEDQMDKSPGKGLENHPRFTLGHLVTGAALTAKYLGADYDIDPVWDEMFRRNGPGDPRLPQSMPDKNPSKGELLELLEAKHTQVERLIGKLDDPALSEKCSWRFDWFYPTVGDMLMFMCITHEAMHLAQLAAWRRGMGLASSLGRL